jgi:hypothetical protein
MTVRAAPITGPCEMHWVTGCVYCQPNGRELTIPIGAPATVEPHPRAGDTSYGPFARYAGQCSVCRARIEEGDPIGFTSQRRVLCEACR